jgi:hypothetical protein
LSNIGTNNEHSSTLIFLALLQFLVSLAGYTFFKRYAQLRAGMCFVRIRDRQDCTEAVVLVKESRHSREEGSSVLQHITVDAVGTALIVASAWISSNPGYNDHPPTFFLLVGF